jgi:hypothetical protein
MALYCQSIYSHAFHPSLRELTKLYHVHTAIKTNLFAASYLITWTSICQGEPWMNFSNLAIERPILEAQVWVLALSKLCMAGQTHTHLHAL